MEPIVVSDDFMGRRAKPIAELTEAVRLRDQRDAYIEARKERLPIDQERSYVMRLQATFESRWGLKVTVDPWRRRYVRVEGEEGPTGEPIYAEGSYMRPRGCDHGPVGRWKEGEETVIYCLSCRLQMGVLR